LTKGLNRNGKFPAMTEWTVGTVLDAIVAAVPDRVMTVCGPRRSTFRESHARIRLLANFLVSQGFGSHRDRSTLQRWECGQDRVALIMHNDLYVDVLIACLRARVVPVNVNHHYSPREVRELLDYVGARAVIYHRSLGPLVAAAVSPECSLLVSVDDGSQEAQLLSSITLDEALDIGLVGHAVAESPDDVLMVCTGGTTGRPKGVLWRQADAYISTMTGHEYDASEAIGAAVPSSSEPLFALSPLMHAAGVSTALTAVLGGRTAVLYDNRDKFDARTALCTAEREKVRTMTIVGDAYAGPLVSELRRQTYELPELVVIGTGGAAINPEHKRALLEQLPRVMIADAFGSSETGGMAASRSSHACTSTTFALHPSGEVVSADRTRFLQPGEDEVGWIARTGRVPLGYFQDRPATEHTFPEIDGVRVAIPGDRAVREGDGTIRLLGRDSLVVNTGGEKVFVEEVEEVVRAHPAVCDAVVIGRPSQRWGQEVVALIAPRVGAQVSEADIHDFCRARLARFKAPKGVVVVDEVRRLGNGKADYRWAKRVALSFDKGLRADQEADADTHLGIQQGRHSCPGESPLA
jgi:3-oxocholest-4-en-26-oate---CoA ligase